MGNVAPPAPLALPPRGHSEPSRVAPSPAASAARACVACRSPSLRPPSPGPEQPPRIRLKNGTTSIAKSEANHQSVAQFADSLEWSLGPERRTPRACGGFREADARTRTGDPFITSYRRRVRRRSMTTQIRRKDGNTAPCCSVEFGWRVDLSVDLGRCSCRGVNQANQVCGAGAVPGLDATGLSWSSYRHRLVTRSMR